MQNPYTRHSVLYEDGHVIFIDKPSGILSHPNPGSNRSSAAFEGSYDLEDRRFDTSAGPLWLIHRLDQEASGILLAVKSKEVAKVCRTAFESKEVEKDYVVLVSRKLIPPKGKWLDFLSEKKTGSGTKVTVAKGPKPNALLGYAMKDFFPRLNLSLVEIRLITGKTHQIRVQSAYHGHPVAGDRLYGNFAGNKELRNVLGLKRLFLHAWRMKIKHPIKNEFLEIKTILPEELENCFLKAK